MFHRPHPAGRRTRAACVPVIAPLRHARWFVKSVASLVLLAFLSLSLQPLALAVQAPPPAKRAAQAGTPPHSIEAQLAATLDELANRLDRLERNASRHQDTRQEEGDIRTLRQQLDALDRAALAQFAATEKTLKTKQLPKVILDRHAQALTHYRTDMTALKIHLDAIDQAPTGATRQRRIKAARDHLKTRHPGKPHPSFDPNDLPSQSLTRDPRNTPRLTPAAFKRAGLHSNPYPRLAALGDFTFDKLPGASDPAYRAETTEVVLTPQIKAKAAELDYNPVKIHTWLRNTIEWLPTWGATQAADITLGSRRGNAQDIASLEIALLRAAGIPARYVHGTVDVPADTFKNWAGGFSSVEAATNFAAMGGIPITQLVSGGKITTVRLEHIWVEAALDFLPSRGAVNKAADSWVQLDPSFKQYQFLPGLDVAAIAGIDPAALAQSYTSTGTINDQEGWVTGLNTTALEGAQAQAQTALDAYVKTNLPNATVGDIIGGRNIIRQNATILPAALPYRSVVIGARYGALPGGLQHHMGFAFGTDPVGEPINPVSFPWAQLNNRKITLSFKPATIADEQTLAALLPEGPITDVSQLPGSIPAYLIQVIPELAINGQTVAHGNALRLGDDLNFTYSPTHTGTGNTLGTGSTHTYTYPVTAGAYLSIAVAGGSVSPAVLDTLKTQLTQTQTTLQSHDTALIGALSREDILGDMFYVGTLGYFGQYLALSQIASQPQQSRHTLPTAYGSLGYEPTVQRVFGIPLSLTAGGIAVNVRLAWAIEPIDGDQTQRKDLNLQTGLLSSALEHAIPEQLFSTPTEPAQGVSAVKALQIAEQQGQRIYHITPNTQAQALPNLHLGSLAMSEITQALATGKDVITHTDPISVPGWTGEGYILFDPVTGSGAYKIAGGGNGGSLFIGLINGFAFAALLGGWAFGAAPLLLLVMGVIVAASIFAATWVMASGDGDVGCYLQGLGAGMELYAIAVALLDYMATLGGAGKAMNIKRLIASLAIIFSINRLSPSTPIQECLF